MPLFHVNESLGSTGGYKMMKANRVIALAALAAFGVALSGTAAAQAIPPSTGSTTDPATSTTDMGTGTTSGDEFTKLDKDKDGMISKKEGKKNKELADRWNTLDANQDGKLDQAEFAQFETAPATDTGGGMSKP